MNVGFGDTVLTKANKDEIERLALIALEIPIASDFNA